MPEYVLKVQDIDEAGKSYDFPVTASWLAGVLSDTDVEAASEGDGSLTLRAHRQGRDIVLTGRVEARLRTPCARCLEPAAVEAAAELVLLLSPRGSTPAAVVEELELTPEDLDRESYSGDEIVLDPVVREQLLLEVPIKPLCREDCAGIAVPEAVRGPGEEPKGALDPRLAPLLSLVGRLPTEE